MAFIKTFSDVDEFMLELRKEAEQPTRFPVRFILVEGLRSWQDLLNALKPEVDHHFYLSDCCADTDTYPIASELRRLVREWLESRGSIKSLIVPWAEWLRLSIEEEYDSDSEALEGLIELARCEKIGNKRIYIPLFEYPKLVDHLQERLTRYRVRDSEYPPIWKLSGEGAVTVEVLPFAIKKVEGRLIEGIKTYFKCWEQGGAKKIVLITRWASELRELCGRFTVRVYPSGYKMLCKKLSSWPESVREDWGKEKYWAWLAVESHDKDSFSELAARLLNMREYDFHQIIRNWYAWTENKKWLAWLWGKVDGKTEGYVDRVLKESNSPEQLEEKLVFNVLMRQITPEEARQRKELLKDMGLTDLPRTFLDRAREITDPVHRLACLAGFSREELVLAVKTVRDLLEEKIPEEKWWDYLEIAYPELTWYMSVPSLESPLREYFLDYTRSRVCDRADERLFEQARQIAIKELLWKFSSREQALEEFRQRNRVCVVWADGMGVEWLGALLGAFSEFPEVEAEFEITRSNLPTVTETNRGWESEEWVERAVDKEGHESPYPDALVKQLEAVCRLARRAVKLLERFEEVIITSDHGLTRFARSSGGFRLPEGVEIDRWGRCAILPPGFPIETLPKPDCLVDGNTIVLLTHERIYGFSGSSQQMHGGATPEEWLVPLVKLRRVRREFAPEEIKVQVLTPSIQLNVHGEGELRLEVIGFEGELELRLQSQVFKGRLEAKDIWIFEMQGLKGDRYEGALYSGGRKLADVEFKAQKGLEEIDLGL
jgi:hypothetical protein